MRCFLDYDSKNSYWITVNSLLKSQAKVENQMTQHSNSIGKYTKSNQNSIATEFFHNSKQNSNNKHEKMNANETSPKKFKIAKNDFVNLNDSDSNDALSNSNEINGEK